MKTSKRTMHILSDFRASSKVVFNFAFTLTTCSLTWSILVSRVSNILFCKVISSFAAFANSCKSSIPFPIFSISRSWNDVVQFDSYRITHTNSIAVGARNLSQDFLLLTIFASLSLSCCSPARWLSDMFRFLEPTTPRWFDDTLSFVSPSLSPP